MNQYFIKKSYLDKTFHNPNILSPKNDLRYLSYISRKEKMLAITKSMALHGLDGYLVSIQVDISNGIPDFQIVRFARRKCKRIQRKSQNSN